MEAKDLRLGNLYRYLHEESESIHTVDIDFLKTQLAYDEDTEDEVFCRGWHACPIPLTEEWLLKFGFEQRNGITIWMKTIQYHDENYPVTLQFTNNGTAMQIARLGIGSACAPCEYVHQLQNLYFALTGEELCLKN